jgi:hypothetical protein
MKRKYSEREPESPGQLEPEAAFIPEQKKERSYYDNADMGSPSSYPKHVLVPASEKGGESFKHTDEGFGGVQSPDDHRNAPVAYSPPDKQTGGGGQGAQVLTPDSVNRPRPSGSYDSQQPASYSQPYHDVYRSPSYNPDMDYGRGSYSGSHSHSGGPSPSGGGDNFVRTRRWACDVCNVATFLSYEEACAHEEICSRRYHESQQYPPRPPPQAYGHREPLPPQGGLGALYHASQEVVTPPTPHRHSSSRWGAHGPPLPVFPHEQNYYRQGQYDGRDDPVPYYEPHGYPHQGPPPQQMGHQQHYPLSYHHPHHPPQDYYQKRMLLAMPSDRDSLSDRQCYVRSEMVEIFAATDKDVSARHSKGAQKLVVGQVGIRCVHCKHLRPRDRAERAVCYPSSISRIYQTVADMQRFHFEQCREIPDHVRQLYKKLKTTRPRGVGSPQTYWMSSAKNLGLVDTETGITFDPELQNKEQVSDMSIGTV